MHRTMGRRKPMWKPNATCAISSPSPAVSVVIPTMGGASPRRRNLVRLLHGLLAHPLFQLQPASEIVINHGNRASWNARLELSQQVAACAVVCAAGGPVVAGAVVNVTQITHRDGPRAELFAASRFFAAAEARNEIVVSMDDDIMPFPSQFALLHSLVCSVRQEATLGAPPGLHGPQIRRCGVQGYGLPRAQEDQGDLFDGSLHRRPRPFPRASVSESKDSRIVLTNFAAVTRTLLRRVTSLFDPTYGVATLALRGDGEDVMFADAVRRLGGRFQAVVRHWRPERDRAAFPPSQRSSMSCGRMAT